MALKNVITMDSGLTVEYWRFRETNLSIAPNANGINVILDGWIDEQKRIDGYSPITEIIVHLDNASQLLNQECTDLYNGFYAVVKTHQDWINAEDV